MIAFITVVVFFFLFGAAGDYLFTKHLGENMNWWVYGFSFWGTQLILKVLEK